MKRTLLCFATAALLVSGSASADLIVTLTKTGADGVTVSISGSGTTTSNPGGVLGFNNFIGQPFGAGIPSGNTPFNLASTLTITGIDSSNSDAAYTSEIDVMDLVRSSEDGSDLNLDGDFSIGSGDTYTASGSSLVTGLAYSDLIEGSYSASTTVGDAGDFGTVTLNIVPEPTSLALLGLGGLLIARRRRG